MNHRSSGGAPGWRVSIMRDIGGIPGVETMEDLALAFGAETVDLDIFEFNEIVIRRFPAKLARLTRTVPLSEDEDTITVALADPSDLDTIDYLHHQLHKQIEMRVASGEQINACLDRFFPVSDDAST